MRRESFVTDLRGGICRKIIRNTCKENTVCVKRWKYGMRVEMASGNRRRRRRRRVRVRTQGAAAIATDRRERERESRYQQEASVLVCASWSYDSRSRSSSSSSCAEENRTNKGCCRIITIAHTCGSYSPSSYSDTYRHHHHHYHHHRPLGRRRLSSSPHFITTADTNTLLVLSPEVRRGKKTNLVCLRDISMSRALDPVCEEGSRGALGDYYYYYYYYYLYGLQQALSSSLFFCIYKNSFVLAMSQNAAADDDYAAEDCGSAAAASLSFPKLLLPEVLWDCVLGGKLLLSFFPQGNLPTYYQQVVFYKKRKITYYFSFCARKKSLLCFVVCKSAAKDEKDHVTIKI